MMYNPQLDTFLCVVEAGSFSKAAEKLYISAPGVIKQINSLEAGLGVQLFARTHRGLVVTAAGRSLYDDAKYLIGFCKESVKRAQEAMQISDDVIRVGISPMTPPQIFVELWPQIQKLYPEMKFQLVPFCAAVSIHHRLAKKERITLQDLDGEHLMLMHRGWSHQVDALRDELAENYPNIGIVDFDFYDVEIFNRCENSNDVLLAIKNWETVHPLMKVIPVEWNYGMPFGLLYSENPDKKVQKLLKAIRTIKGTKEKNRKEK